ncbi:hypothetical protein [Nocardioides flavescens]|uniref:Secreted protein n=1 Tax=Nocardioides flavescens TaxID=2691959 RepID=A0A6L7EZ64_9ACTN|nr:hypothetical protein [Nocardioides flavescens]MXG89201.1 hypothetical protein [Nocardioides flavescens]
MTTPARLLAAVLSSPLALTATAHAASAAPAPGVEGQTQVVANCTAYRQTPRRVIGACADAGAIAVVRDWTSWTAHQARGTGTWVVNTCEPDCAAGDVERYPATFSLHRVRTVDGTRVFTRLGVTYVEGGEQRNETVALPRTPIGG